jgi:hypothetical protein
MVKQRDRAFISATSAIPCLYRPATGVNARLRQSARPSGDAAALFSGVALSVMANPREQALLPAMIVHHMFLDAHSVIGRLFERPLHGLSDA